MKNQAENDLLEREIGVALSGGGNRAALFGLGVLLFLSDAGLTKRLGAIWSVSGGSFTNAFLALNTDLKRPAEKEQVWDAGRTLSQQICTEAMKFSYTRPVDQIYGSSERKYLPDLKPTRTSNFTEHILCATDLLAGQAEGG